jgi:hypothetical protein
MTALLVLYTLARVLLDNIPYSSLFWRLDIAVVSWRGGVDHFFISVNKGLVGKRKCKNDQSKRDKII